MWVKLFDLDLLPRATWSAHLVPPTSAAALYLPTPGVPRSPTIPTLAIKCSKEPAPVLTIAQHYVLVAKQTPILSIDLLEVACHLSRLWFPLKPLEEPAGLPAVVEVLAAPKPAQQHWDFTSRTVAEQSALSVQTFKKDIREVIPLGKGKRSTEWRCECCCTPSCGIPTTALLPADAFDPSIDAP